MEELERWCPDGSGRPGLGGGRVLFDKNLTLVERFTRVDAATLEYEYTVTDPETWTRPWTASIPLQRTDVPMYEYACHEGNLSMYGMLAGRRADEKAAAARP